MHKWLIIALSLSVETRNISCWEARNVFNVTYFGMTRTRAETFCRPQRSTEWMASGQNTSNGCIWPLYVGAQNVGSKIVTEAKLDSWTLKAQLPDKRKTFFSYRGPFFCIVLSSAHTYNSTNSNIFIDLIEFSHKPISKIQPVVTK